MSETIQIRAAREFDLVAGSASEAALAATLAGLLEVAPIDAMETRVGSDADGGGLIAVTVDGAAEQQVAHELRSELAVPFELYDAASPNAAGHHFWLLSPVSAAAVGFEVIGSRAAGTRRWTPVSGFAEQLRQFLRAWLSLALEYPALEFVTAVEHDAAAGESQAFRVRLGVTSAADQLPWRAHALVASLFPGFALVSRDRRGVTMVTDRAGAEALLRVPHACDAPLLGIAVALARPIPVLALENPGTASGVRIGVAVSPSGLLIDEILDEKERRRHIHILGKTGTGKSSLEAAIAHNAAVAGEGMLVVDPHGDLCEKIIAELPEEEAHRVWWIRAADTEHPVPLNPFALDDESQFEVAVQDFILIFYKLFDPKHQGIVGPRFEAFLTHGLRGLRAKRGRMASMLDVARIYRNPRIEREIAGAVSDPRESEFWRGEMRGMTESSRSEIVGWVTSKFDRFANTASLRGILETGADAFDPAKAMDDGRIILLDLSKGRLGEVASSMLGFLYLTRFWTSMTARQTRSTFNIIVDEATSFDAGSLPSLLSEGRKFGAAVTIAHQFLAQLEGDLADALEGNVATTAAFRAGAADAAEIVKRVGGGLTVDQLIAQPDLQAVLSRTSGVVLPRPHTLLVDHNERVPRRTGEEYERFAATIRHRTIRQLVVPFRELRAYEPEEPQRTKMEVLRPTQDAGTRLREWTARHEELLAAQKEQPPVPEEDAVAR